MSEIWKKAVFGKRKGSTPEFTAEMTKPSIEPEKPGKPDKADEAEKDAEADATGE